MMKFSLKLFSFPIFLFIIFGQLLPLSTGSGLDADQVQRSHINYTELHAPPSRGLPKPINPYMRGCEVENHCRGYLSSLLKEDESNSIRLNVTRPGNHTKVVEVVAAAFAEYLLAKNNGNASEPLTVLVWNDSNTSTPMFQGAIDRGITSRKLHVKYRLLSGATQTEDEVSFHSVHGNITIKACLDWVDYKFSTPAGPLSKIEMQKMLERAAEIDANVCAEGPCSVKKNLTLEVNMSHTHGQRSFQDYGNKVLMQLKNHTASDPNLTQMHSEDGVRASGFVGWFFLRLDPPVLILYIEAPTLKDAVELGRYVAASLKQCYALKTDALDKFVQSHE